MQIDRLVNGPPTVPPNGCRFRNGVALVSLLILETLYGSEAKFRCSFMNCLGMALFLDFCRVQPVSNFSVETVGLGATGEGGRRHSQLGCRCGEERRTLGRD